jgi:hypothetical protein
MRNDTSAYPFPSLRYVVRKKGEICMLQAYVSSVSYVLGVCCECFMQCCKSRSDCCMYCNGCTCMLQASTPNVSYVFPDVCCKYVYLDVVYVSHICCKCFILMLRMFYNSFECFSGIFCKCFRCMLQVFHLSLGVCCNCYIWMFQK